MKKTALLFAFICVCQVGFCQKNVNQLFNEFSKQAKTTKVKIGKIAMSFVNLFEDTMGVDGVEILAFGSCTDEVKSKFKEAVRTLKDPAFETLINVNQDGERTKVMIRIKNDTIHELVVITSGSDAALVRIKGKIRRSDIERLVNRHS